MTNALLKLTPSNIQADIAAYQQRIVHIQARLLGELSPARDTSETRYKRRKQRKELGQQIVHIRSLIRMAEKALPGGKWHEHHRSHTI